MTEKKYHNSEEMTARFGKALGHPARIVILKFLATQSSCYFGELHEILPLTKASVSQHMSELKDAGLVKGNFEPPKVRYCINEENWNYAQNLFGALFDSFGKTGSKCSKK